ncbi:MFS transporter [Candidatus Pacearchaeota archaeon]|nr:MFS transporter [Candidatus Pacearchaeota archaeon]
MNKTIQQKFYDARRHSIKEGIFAAARTSFGDSYVAPFAIAIKASNSVVALLTSVLGLLGPLSQVFGSKLIGKESRKRILTKTVFIEAMMWVPFILIAALFYFNIITNLLPLTLLFFFSTYTIFQNLGHPAWFSWMGDIVEEKHRGRWFSKRNLITGFAAVIIAILAALLLDFFKKQNLELAGFSILFLLALVSRLISLKILKKQYEPKLKVKDKAYFSFKEFFLNAKNNNFGRFTIYRAMIALSSAICASLVAVYLIRDLRFSYTNYMLIIMGGTFLSLFSMEIWGKFADKYGNYKAVIISSIVIPIIPILWILHASIWYLLFIPSLIEGIAWAGMNLATGNFIYDNVSPQKRGLAVSYLNMMWGIGVFIGATVSAILIKFLNTSFITPIIAIFIISAIARALVAAIGLSKIREVRKTKSIPNTKSFIHIVFKGARPTLVHEVHEVTSIGSYLRMK